MTPVINTSGVFRFKAPFDRLYDGTEIYTCIAVRKFNDIVNQGRDPYNLYYEPHDLPESVYETDTREHATIVSLQAHSDARVIQIPSSYIEAYPSQGGVPYENIALVLSLGPMENGKDLSFVQAEVVDLIRSLLGIEIESRFVKTSNTHYFPQAEHESIEAARALLIERNTSTRAQLLEAQAQLTQLKQENQSMREYIESNLV